MITERLDAAINRYYDENGLEPKYIVLNATSYAELNYESAIKAGLDEEDAYLTETTDYKFITVAITHSKNLKDFELVG